MMMIKDPCYKLFKKYPKITLAQSAQMILDLEAKNVQLRKGLRRLQFAPTEDSCEIDGHPCTCTDENDEHYNSCCGCGNYKCEGCKPDCWLKELLK